MRPGIVHISGRRHVRIDAVAKFLPNAALHVLGQIVHVVFRLPECDLEHELALRRVLKPESRKLECRKFPGIEVVDQASAVNLCLNGQDLTVFVVGALSKISCRCSPIGSSRAAML